MAQFGISGEPEIASAWSQASFEDDEPMGKSNVRGTISFAKTARPNSRSTQLFINYGDNARLDKSGFTPFGKVIKGMKVVDALYNGYGESTTRAQGAIAAKGNAFLREKYPELDYITRAKLLP